MQRDHDAVALHGHSLEVVLSDVPVDATARHVLVEEAARHVVTLLIELVPDLMIDLVAPCPPRRRREVEHGDEQWGWNGLEHFSKDGLHVGRLALGQGAGKDAPLGRVDAEQVWQGRKTVNENQ